MSEEKKDISIEVNKATVSIVKNPTIKEHEKRSKMEGQPTRKFGGGHIIGNTRI